MGCTALAVAGDLSDPAATRSLRLGFASGLTDGTSSQELMELGGWNSYEMVLRYAHLAPDHLSHAAPRMERPLEIAEHIATTTPGSVDEKMDVKA